ncbi:hypothetical protein Ancab_032661, partial [Ancistrocladus abbreviatus]
QLDMEVACDTLKEYEDDDPNGFFEKFSEEFYKKSWENRKKVVTLYIRADASLQA